MVDKKDVKKELLEKFRQVCSERVNTLIAGFTALVRTPGNVEVADSLMREIHTLKGELRIMGFNDGQRIVHKLEDVFKKLGKTSFGGAASFADLLSEGLDGVSGIVLRDTPPDVEGLLMHLAAFEEVLPGGAAGTPLPEESRREPVPSRSGGKAPAADRQVLAPKVELSSIVRVSGAKLDELGEMTGDLFTSTLRLRKLSGSLDGILDAVRTLSGIIRNLESQGEFKSLPPDMNPVPQCQALARDLAQFRRAFLDRSMGNAALLDKLLEHVQELRLLPVSNLFDVYQGLARDLAREKGKLVDLRVEGGTALVDRSVLDPLGDILLHLIRNAVDHGTEPPKERARLGKPDHGTITLRARPVGDRVVIEVEDDGRGIDLEQVRTAALRRGLVAEADAPDLDEASLLALIFKPGLSTLEDASEVSGRGVGLDVVQTKAQQLGGSVRVRSQAGGGTCLTVELPTSLAISRVMLFRVAGQVFALLASFVDRVERLERKELVHTGIGRVVELEGRFIPVVEAAELLQLIRAPRQASRLSLVVLDHAGQGLALIVDELIGERELTIKPLSPFLAGIRGVTGTAQLEDGSVVLLLHAVDLIAGAGHAKAGPAAQAGGGQAVRRVLLVEDSLITRELEKSILTALGLLVEEAVDGAAAMELLAGSQFDIIVSDVAMPRLDGFELTRRVKKDSRWSKIPVILVTTHGSPEDRRQGLEAGADAYIVKGDFKSDSFIETVRRFLP